MAQRGSNPIGEDISREPIGLTQYLLAIAVGCSDAQLVHRLTALAQHFASDPDAGTTISPLCR